jgi:hypothetical protein
VELTSQGPVTGTARIRINEKNKQVVERQISKQTNLEKAKSFKLTYI